MSKQTINLVNNIVSNAVKNEVAKIKLENTSFDGKTVLHKGKSIVSFGSYSYLGLEVDERLKNGAIEAISNYGIQYPSSRIYSTLPLYEILLDHFKQIFGTSVVLTTSLSLGHAGVMPIIIERDDILILDQHAHSSIQDASERLKVNGVKVTILRHNDLETLEKRIIEYSNKYDKVWYAIDGIYSMFGDTAPIEKLESLLNKYPKFHLYADDAHGISSYGKHGAGWILSKISLHRKMVLATGMAKAFGTMGGVFITDNETFYQKINNCTGSLIFSGPHPIPVLGASIKSAEIHLSDEIYQRQQYLMDRISFCHDLLRKECIPEISEKDTPIFFVAISKLNAGYKLVDLMKKDGFLTNIAAFPAVSESCTGVRFTISLHHSYNDIQKLVFAFKKNYPLALKEENTDFECVKRAFRKHYNFPDNLSFHNSIESNINLKVYDSINDIPNEQQKHLLSNKNLFSIDFLNTLEQCGRNGKTKEDKWRIFYCSVSDQNGRTILITIFTIMLIKEDMLSSIDISNAVEAIREHDKYYLSSKTLFMGTPLTEGNHLYIDESHPKKREALRLLLKETDRISEEKSINATIYRDFDSSNHFIHDFLIGESFLPINLPDNHEIDFKSKEIQDFISTQSKKRRKYIRDKVFAFEDQFNVTVHDTPSLEQVINFYSLYLNVANKAREINLFPTSFEVFQKILTSKGWSLLELKKESKTVAMMLVFDQGKFLHPLFVGLDYSYLADNVYPMILWKTIKLAKSKGREVIKLGYSASQIKRKFGATIQQRKCYYKSKDNYNQLILANYNGQSAFIQ